MGFTNVRIEEAIGGALISDGTSNGSGLFTDTFTFSGNQDVLVKVPDKEMSESSQDRDNLRRIAEASRSADGTGRYVFLTEAGSLVEDFKDRKAFESREDTSTRPVWDSYWSLLVLLVILAVEWLLRKRARLV